MGRVERGGLGRHVERGGGVELVGACYGILMDYVGMSRSLFPWV